MHRSNALEGLGYNNQSHAHKGLIYKNLSDVHKGLCNKNLSNAYKGLGYKNLSNAHEGLGYTHTTRSIGPCGPFHPRIRCPALKKVPGTDRAGHRAMDRTGVDRYNDGPTMDDLE